MTGSLSRDIARLDRGQAEGHIDDSDARRRLQRCTTPPYQRCSLLSTIHICSSWLGEPRSSQYWIGDDAGGGAEAEPDSAARLA